MRETQETRSSRSPKNSVEPATFSGRSDRLNLEDVRLLYRRCASFYNVLFGRICRPGRRNSIALVNTLVNQRIPEGGAGLALLFYRTVAAVVGIHVSPEMLGKARVCCPVGLENGGALLEMNGEQMDFEDSNFDCVFVSESPRLFPIRRVL